MIRNTVGRAINRGRKQSSKDKIPLENCVMLLKGATDYIVLSVSDHALLDPYWQAFFFDDPTTPKTDVTAADVIADPNINIPGGNVFYSATRNNIVIYGPSPIESAERRLWRYEFGTQFELMTDNGEPMLDNGQQMYEVANA